jgi:hypothetical protein
MNDQFTGQPFGPYNTFPMPPLYPQIGAPFVGQLPDVATVDNSRSTYPVAQSPVYGQLVHYDHSVYSAPTYDNHQIMAASAPVPAPAYAQGFGNYSQSFVAPPATALRALPPPPYMTTNSANLQQGKDREQKPPRPRAGSANPSNAAPTFAMRSAIGQPIRPLYTIEQSHLYGVLHIKQVRLLRVSAFIQVTNCYF